MEKRLVLVRELGWNLILAATSRKRTSRPFGVNLVLEWDPSRHPAPLVNGREAVFATLRYEDFRLLGGSMVLQLRL